jgi:O-antigen/teichoic acid export membrane protein
VKISKTIIQILKNTVSSWGMVAVQAAVGLIMVPFLLGQMGREGYGVIGIIAAIIGFSNIADLGLRQALNRELAEKVALEDKEGFRSLSSSALLLYVGIALLIGGTGAMLAPWLCSVFNVGEQYRGVVILLLRTYAPFTVLLSFVTPVFTAGICSFMRYDVQNHITMVSQLLISLMLFASLSVSDANPLIIWCMVMMVGGLIRIGAMWFFYRKVCFGGQLSVRFIDFKILRPLFSLGGSMYVLQLTQMLSVQMDPLIISSFIGPAGVAVYQAGSRVPQMIRPLVEALTSQLTPLTTKYHVASNRKREQQVLILGTKYTLYLGAFFSAAMILFADPFCHLWLFDKLGEDVQIVALVLKMWAVANLFNHAGGSQWSILLAKRKMKFAIGLNVPVAIFNFILSVILVGYTDLGLVGVLVGTVVSECIRRPVVQWYVSNIIGLKFRTYILRAYVTPILFLLLLVGFGALGLSWVTIEDWGQLILLGLAMGVFSAILLSVMEWQLIGMYLGRAVSQIHKRRF